MTFLDGLQVSGDISVAMPQAHALQELGKNITTHPLLILQFPFKLLHCNLIAALLLFFV